MISKPYIFSILLAILFFIGSFLRLIETIDIYLFDTYYIVRYDSLLKTLAAFFLIFAAVYKWLDKYFKVKLLTWLHILFTATILMLATWQIMSFNQSLALIEITSSGSSQYFAAYQKHLQLMLMIFILLQIFPALNIIISLLRIKNQTVK